MLQIILNGKRKETMADVTKKTTNKFTKGLVMDFSPENTRNEVLTHALNATLLTFNGNELSLQNDMGNARVETAYLPEGFMPVGTCEYGGIIYIVSYNPLENKSQIGCFPSPERNISRDELGEALTTPLNSSDFQEKDDNDQFTGVIKNNSKYVLLKNDELHPGDKFIVTSDSSIYNNDLADLYKYDAETSQFVLKEHPIIALNIVSIEESGKIIYLNSDIRQYEHKTNGDTYKYHILGETATNDEEPFDQQAIDLDSYRNVLSSGYSVFKQKTSGKLALLAELIMIDSYSVTHSLVPNNKGGFDIVIHSDVSPTIDNTNWSVAPKLQYLYLENSQGYLQNQSTGINSEATPLFIGETQQNINSQFLDTKLKTLFSSSNDNMFSDKQTLGSTGEFNFPKRDSYHGELIPLTGTTIPSDTRKLITKFRANCYHRINLDQIAPTNSEGRNYEIYLPYYANLNAQYYHYNVSQTGYTKWDKDYLSEDYTYYIEDTKVSYIDAERNTEYKDKPLYKKGSEIQIATSVQIDDVTIEKFVYQNVHKYTQATPEQIADSSITKWHKKGDTYIETKTEDEKTYTQYVQTVERNLISAGTTVDEVEKQGFVYYYPENEDYIAAETEDLQKYWDFNSYPASGEDPITLYYKDVVTEKREATKQELIEYNKETHDFYYQAAYEPIPDLSLCNITNLNLYIKFPTSVYIPSTIFIPNTNDNWVSGYPIPDIDLDQNPNNGPDLAPEENSIVLYEISDYIPQRPNGDHYLPYNDITLASIQIPEVLMNNGIDLPFKYDYTIVPCMNYGRLDHLRVSNTVDFSNLHKFAQSGFNTWKYRIDGEQLRLTFGADIYDTFENDKVDGLILEFYDLWGFVGSLEISNKKSYNGEFTKILYLNSLGTLSNKKINVNQYSENYQHNINIVKKDNQFFLNDKEVEWINYDQGWRYKEGNDKNLDTNDVGVLYPNLLYGVKSYLLRTKNKGTSEESQEFIPKQEFFLYTLPIFNDYYYTTNNFNSITNPKLDFVLTYKITDKSDQLNYSENGITDGYHEIDKSNIDAYLSGRYQQGTELQAVKYYKYEGISKLQLEIGLNQELANLGLRYDPAINELFRCTLELKNDDDTGSYTVHSDDESIIHQEQILNYYNQDTQVLQSDINYLSFDSGSNYPINNNFNNYNFLYSSGTQSINIKYGFIVGYKILIDKIRETQVPATTVCALFHKNTEGEYNYKDFSIYKSSQLDPIEYPNSSSYSDYAKALSNITPEKEEGFALLYENMFYNSGDTNYEHFGLCTQRKYQHKHKASDYATALNLDEEVSLQSQIVTPVQPRYSAGALNSYAIKDIKNNIGKLAFCLPHIHTIDDSYGVSIEFGYPSIANESKGPWFEDTGRKLFMRDPDTDKRVPKEISLITGFDSAYGSKGHLALWPQFNLSAITKELMQQESKFISAIDYATQEDGWEDNAGIKVRTYTGFTGKQLAIFNRKMLETMKSVYAYNPDYDSLTVNLGNVSTQTYTPYVTSNIISTNASIVFRDNTTLNDYIFIDTMLFSQYLRLLTANSTNEANIGIKTYTTNQDNTITFIPQVQFIPGLTYCGINDNPYLISSLTYNLPVPLDLQSELEFSSNDNIVVKDSNGDNKFLKGTPSKKALYGYDQDSNKLIELDVSNYTIDENGSLSLKSLMIEEKPVTIEVSVPDNNLKKQCSTNITQNFEGVKQQDLTITFTVQAHNHWGFVRKDDYYYGLDNNYDSTPYSEFSNSFYFDLTQPITCVSSDQNVTFDIKVNKIYCDYKCQIFKHFDWANQMTKEIYEALLDDSVNTVIIGETTYDKSQLKVQTLTKKITYGDSNTSLAPEPDGSYSLSPRDEMLNSSAQNDPNDEARIRVFKVKINKIECTIVPRSSIKSITRSIISTNKTELYSSVVENKYTVFENYQDSVLRGTSITLNDLIYDYGDSHRLFLDSKHYNYNDKPVGKLYYRSYNRAGGGPSQTLTEYHYDTYSKNRIFLYTGPCYTESNL